jgi:chromosome segregation ATPase
LTAQLLEKLEFNAGNEASPKSPFGSPLKYSSLRIRTDINGSVSVPTPVIAIPTPTDPLLEENEVLREKIKELEAGMQRSCFIMSKQNLTLARWEQRYLDKDLKWRNRMEIFDMQREDLNQELGQSRKSNLDLMDQLQVLQQYLSNQHASIKKLSLQIAELESKSNEKDLQIDTLKELLKEKVAEKLKMKEEMAKIQKFGT